MNKADLVEQISQKANVTRKESMPEVTSGILACRVLAEKVLTATLESVIKAVASGDRVSLVGFGSFEQRTRNARIGRNPQTGEEIQIPPQTVPVFTASKQFKEAVVTGEVEQAA